MWAPHGADPSSLTVEVKARDYCFTAGHASRRHRAPPPPCRNVTLRSVAFSACTFQLRCDASLVDDVDADFASYNRRVTEFDRPKSSAAASTTVIGDGNTLRGVRVRRTNNNGVHVEGNDTLIDNALINSTDWLGTLTYAPLAVNGHRNVVTRSTVTYFGNAGIHIEGADNRPPPATSRADNTVSHCRVAFGGLIGEDTALLYTGSPRDAGTVWHHNWVHDAVEKCMRGDDQSRHMTVHHNVLWNCGTPRGDAMAAGWGVILKGDFHRVYQNTIFATQRSSVCLPACAEPRKPWVHQWPLLAHQNNHTWAFNNAVASFTGFPCSCHQPGPAGGVRTANFEGDVAAMQLRNPRERDFRPAADSPLVGAGTHVPPFTPAAGPVDVGAYAHGDAAPWRPGCTGWPGCGL